MTELEHKLLLAPQIQKAQTHVKFWYYEFKMSHENYTIADVLSYFKIQKQILICKHYTFLYDSIKSKQFHSLQFGALVQLFLSQSSEYLCSLVNVSDQVWLKIKSGDAKSYVDLQTGDLYSTPQELTQLLNQPLKLNPHADELESLSMEQTIEVINHNFYKLRPDFKDSQIMKIFIREYLNPPKPDTHQIEPASPL